MGQEIDTVTQESHVVCNTSTFECSELDKLTSSSRQPCYAVDKAREGGESTSNLKVRLKKSNSKPNFLICDKISFVGAQARGWSLKGQERKKNDI